MRRLQTEEAVDSCQKWIPIQIVMLEEIIQFVKDKFFLVACDRFDNKPAIFRVEKEGAAGSFALICFEYHLAIHNKLERFPNFKRADVIQCHDLTKFLEFIACKIGRRQKVEAGINIFRHDLCGFHQVLSHDVGEPNLRRLSSLGIFPDRNIKIPALNRELWDVAAWFICLLVGAD